VFKPAGRPTATLEEVALTLEEYEAIRLADFEGLYQEEAARRMGVSRQTFGRAVATARAKVARVLVLGCVLRVETAETLASAPGPDTREFFCRACGRRWREPFGAGRPAACPGCGGQKFQRLGCGKAHAQDGAARPTPCERIATPTQNGEDND